MAPLPPAATLSDRELVRASAVRRAVVADPVVRRAAAVGALWLVAYAAAVVALPAGSLANRVVGGVVYLVPWAVAGILAVRASRASTGRRRTLWRLIAASNLLWLGGDVTWAVIDLGLGRDPFPSPADVLYLVALVLLLPAIAAAFGGARDWANHLDASTMGLVVGFVGYTALVAPQVTGGVTVAGLVSAAYPMLGIAVLMLLCDRVFARHRVIPASTLLVTLAVLAGVAGNAGFSYLVTAGLYDTGALLEVAWQLQAVLFCLGALVACRFDEPAPDADDASRDPGLVLMLGGLTTCFAMVVVQGGTPALVLLGYAIGAVVLRLWLTTRDRARLAGELQRALVHQERLALSDPLTGLHNRRFFEAALDIEVERARRDDAPLGVLVLDLDHFKRINDRWGHPVGDAVLREAATRLAGAVRGHDVVARYGGEEFVAVLPGADARVVGQIAERCRAALAGSPFASHGAGTLDVTASVGGAVWPDGGASGEELTRAADRALYAAKRSGRDRVVLDAYMRNTP